MKPSLVSDRGMQRTHLWLLGILFVEKTPTCKKANTVTLNNWRKSTAGGVNARQYYKKPADPSNSILPHLLLPGTRTPLTWPRVHAAALVNDDARSGNCMCHGLPDVNTFLWHETRPPFKHVPVRAGTTRRGRHRGYIIAPVHDYERS